MRIWDIPTSKLCRNHLLGEHRELHAIWSILTRKKKGYSRHPETLRWKDRLKALYSRHKKIIKELKRRGYKHNSPLDSKLAAGKGRQTRFVDSVGEQIRILRTKSCGCKV